MNRAALAFLIAGTMATSWGQEQNPTQANVGGNRSESMPIYRVQVVARTTPAINFHHRQGETKVDLRGTALMPTAKGEAEVRSNTGATKMYIRTDKMLPPSTFGPEFLTYVIWAVTPQGRPKNLGELVMKGGGNGAQIDATTDLQAFGLIVTAEPYWAVSQPSDVVVMENVIRKDTTGTLETIDAKYELLQRGQYTMNITPDRLTPLTRNADPLQLREARQAIAIAKAQGAENYASDTIQKALIDLQNAEGYNQGKGDVRALETVARQATQMAEDARLISIRKAREEALAAERQAAADRQAEAEARAKSEREKAEQADADRRAAEQARLDADQMRKEAEQARAAALAAQEEAQRQAQLARSDADKAKKEQVELRGRLLQQLNTIMETRDTARGLIMNMSDVLFDFGKATLRPNAREALAKVSGILLAYPSLRVQVEGHTDSIGSDAFNQNLSEKRAFGVRDYLVSQNVDGNRLTATGFGKTRPIASNDTNEGRQKNRRVELIVSGDIIGQPLTDSPSAKVNP